MGKRHKAEYYQHFSDLPIDILRKRNVGYADLTLMLFMRLYSTVATVFPRLLEQEHRLLHVVKRMEDRGLMIDVPEIDVQDRQMDKILEDVQDFCEGMVGRDDFNINSRADLVEILKIANVYGQLKERTAPTKRFPEGQPKLDSFNLRQLHHPAPLMILLGKGAAKLKANFLAQLRTANVNGVVHPNYNQLGTTTGRFSCSNPNLQNVPTENVGRMHGSPEELAEEEDMTGTK
jgi:DNA polymerase-1